MSRRRRTRKPESAVVAAIAAELAPTPELAGRFDVVARAGVQGGKRIQSRLEKWLESGVLKPESAAAGHRFGMDYAIALGKSRGTWRLGLPPTKTGADFDPHQARLDAMGRVRAAAAALDAEPPPCAWLRASEAVRLLVIEDMPVAEISTRAGIANDKTLRRLLLGYLDALATHYSQCDALRGRDTTPRSRGAALQLFSPPLDADEAA
jgi:hypothetical protein